MMHEGALLMAVDQPPLLQCFARVHCANVHTQLEGLMKMNSLIISQAAQNLLGCQNLFVTLKI